VSGNTVSVADGTSGTLSNVTLPSAVTAASAYGTLTLAMGNVLVPAGATITAALKLTLANTMLLGSGPLTVHGLTGTPAQTITLSTTQWCGGCVLTLVDPQPSGGGGGVLRVSLGPQALSIVGSVSPVVPSSFAVAGTVSVYSAAATVGVTVSGVIPVNVTYSVFGPQNSAFAVGAGGVVVNGTLELGVGLSVAANAVFSGSGVLYLDGVTVGAGATIATATIGGPVRGAVTTFVTPQTLSGMFVNWTGAVALLGSGDWTLVQAASALPGANVSVPTGGSATVSGVINVMGTFLASGIGVGSALNLTIAANVAALGFAPPFDSRTSITVASGGLLAVEGLSIGRGVNIGGGGALSLSGSAVIVPPLALSIATICTSTYTHTYTPHTHHTRSARFCLALPQRCVAHSLP
jgi:hypothetical protein